MNIILVIVFFTIILIQLYQINLVWIRNNLFDFYEFINNNSILINFILSFIPIILTVLQFLFNKLSKLIQKKSHKDSSFNSKKNTSIFPGIITNEMITNNEVIFIKDLNINSDYDKPLILDRNKQCEKILLQIENLKKESNKHKFNCLFLTGMSGSGKSILLNNFLLDKLKENNKVTLINTNYNNGNIIYKKIESDQSNIVIMDQFEDSLSYPSFYSCIRKMNQINRDEAMIFVFSFPQDFFYLIHKNLSDVFSEEIDKDSNFMHFSTYFITNDNYDISQLKILINRFTQEDFQNIDKCLEECKTKATNNGSFKSIVQAEMYSPSLIYLCSILSRIDVGISPLVEFSTLSYIYELFEQEISANLGKYVDNLDNVIDLYLNHWVNKFPHPQAGKMILYLLSDRKIYTTDDLKFITFEPENYFINSKQSEEYNIINAIDNNSFLCVKSNYNGFSSGFSSIHDYIGLKLNEYCFRNLSNELRQNVDYYRKIMTKSLDNKRPTAFSNEKSEIQRRYNTFNKKQVKYFINSILLIVSFACLLINLNIFSFNIKKTYLNYSILLSIGCFLAIYYYYNLIMQSTRILNIKKYIIMLLLGAVTLPLCYIFPNYYGIFMGITVLSMGITQYIISFTTVYEARNHFYHTGRLYAFFGVIIISFGLIYNISPHYSFHLFFIIYVIGANYGHTKYSYSIDRIGKLNTIRFN